MIIDGIKKYKCLKSIFSTLISPKRKCKQNMSPFPFPMFFFFFEKNVTLEKKVVTVQLNKHYGTPEHHHPNDNRE